MKRNFPTTWKVQNLHSIATLSGRIGWKGLTAKEYTSSGPLFLSVHSLNYGDIVDFRDAFHISQERYDESPEIMLQKGDVLICKDGAGIGKCGIIDSLPGPTTINSSLLMIRASGSVKPKYLYYALLSPYFQKIVQSRLEGATTPHLYQRDIKTFPIPLPPLPEQKRIVSILDEAFAGIDKAIANTEKNLANARELFESYLNTIFTQKGEGWEEANLGSKIELLTGFAFKSKGYTESDNGINLLRGDNIIQGEFRWENVKKWPKSEIGLYDKYKLAKDDVVLAMDRTWVKAGLKYAQIHDADLPCLLVQRVARIRAKEGTSINYIKHLIGSKLFTDYVLSIQTGTGVPHISGKQINAFACKFPNFHTQNGIAKKVKTVQKQTNCVISNFEKKISSLQELKQSILQKAFTGELTQ